MSELCYVEPSLRLLENRYIMTVIFLTGLSISLKMKKESVLALVTSLFFLLSYSLSCDFKLLDPERTLRYVFWVGLDTIYVVILFCFWQLRRVQPSQFLLICGLEVSSFAMQAARLADSKLNNYAFTDYFYVEFMNAYNIAIIVVVGLPIIRGGIERIKEVYNGRKYSNVRDNDLFDARVYSSKNGISKHFSAGKPSQKR